MVDTIDNFKLDYFWLGDVTSVLIVEHGAMFNYLVHSGICQTAKCIMVTGCGNPDFSTRAMVYIQILLLLICVFSINRTHP